MCYWWWREKIKELEKCGKIRYLKVKVDVRLQPMKLNIIYHVLWRNILTFVQFYSYTPILLLLRLLAALYSVPLSAMFYQLSIN